jgi:hypothetical protein
VQIFSSLCPISFSFSSVFRQDQITRRLQRKKKKKYYRVPKEKEELEHKGNDTTGEELPLLDHKSQRSGKHKPEVDDDKDLV